MREYNAPNNEVVLYSYGIGFLYLFVAMLLSGNIMTGLRFCATVQHVIIFSIEMCILINTFCRYPVSHSNLRLRVPVQPDGLPGHTVCADIGAHVWCSAGRHRDHRPEGDHDCHFVSALQQAVQCGVSETISINPLPSRLHSFVHRRQIFVVRLDRCAGNLPERIQQAE